MAKNCLSSRICYLIFNYRLFFLFKFLIIKTYSIEHSTHIHVFFLLHNFLFFFFWSFFSSWCLLSNFNSSWGILLTSTSWVQDQILNIFSIKNLWEKFWPESFYLITLYLIYFICKVLIFVVSNILIIILVNFTRCCNNFCYFLIIYLLVIIVQNQGCVSTT